MTADPETPPRSLLYLTPVIPATGGNGLAMRAGAVLRILARRHRVTLVAVPRYPPYSGDLAPELAGLCRRVAVVEPPGRWRRLRRLITGGRAPDRAFPFHDHRFDIVHVFRLSMLDAARRYLAGPGGGEAEWHLDLDDIESEVFPGIAELHRAAGRDGPAAAAADAARRARTLEDEVLASCDRVYVCSEADRARLLPRARAQIVVLPNTVQLPATAAPRRRDPDADFGLLFVGTLGYTPNADAVRFLCEEIVPRIEERTARGFRVVIAGGGAPGTLRQVARSPRVTLTGRVPELTPLYRQADAVVVPLRAGGGTRIKVLEAFSHRRPVVSTSVGIAGIEARHQEHLLVADEPEPFADCCLRLMAEPDLGRNLADAAAGLVARRYTVEAVAAALDAVPAPGRRPDQSGGSGEGRATERSNP